MSVNFDMNGQQGMDFSLGEELLYIMDFGKKLFFTNSSFSHYKMLTDGLLSCGLLFLSTVWTLVLMAPICCKGSFGNKMM